MGSVYTKRHKNKDGSWFISPALWISFKHHGRWHAESSGTNNLEEAVERLKARVNELSAGRKTVKEDKIRYEDLVKQLKLDYKVNKKRSIDSLGFYLKHLDQHFKGFKAVEIRGSDVLEYVAKRQEEGAANSSINRELSALKRVFSLARIAGDIVYQPHIQLLDESDNVRQGFVNPAEFVKLHDNLPGYLKPIIEFLYLTGMRSGAAKKLEHKHVDLEAQVIRLPIELSKNKKGLTIPLSGRLLVLVESAWNNRSISCPYLFHHKAEPIGDFRKAFDAACAAAGLQGIVPHDLRRSAVRNFIRAGVKESVAMRLSGHRTRSVFDRYNIVSEDDLVEANEKVLAFLCEAIKESKIEKLKE
jgi:integrase